MAGFGVFKPSDVDMEAVRDLPTGTDKESKMRRKKMFRTTDMNGNYGCSVQTRGGSPGQVGRPNFVLGWIDADF